MLACALICAGNVAAAESAVLTAPDGTRTELSVEGLAAMPVTTYP